MNHPQDLAGNPQDVAGNPQDVAGNPQDVAGNPQDVAGNPQDVAGNPQDVAGNHAWERLRAKSTSCAAHRPDFFVMFFFLHVGSVGLCVFLLPPIVVGRSYSNNMFFCPIGRDVVGL